MTRPLTASADRAGLDRACYRISPATKAARHAKIAAILSQPGEPVRSQEELADRLAVLGIKVTQATLSRDLDELGAVRLRGPGGALVYALPSDPADAPAADVDDVIFRQAAAAVAGWPDSPPAPRPRPPPAWPRWRPTCCCRPRRAAT